MDAEELLSVRRRGDAVRAVETEILQEKAGALGRAGNRLEEALEAVTRTQEALEEIERRIRSRQDSNGREDRLREVQARLSGDLEILRSRADLAYQFLIIQREAVGVRNHSDVERCYHIAERLR